MACRAVMTTCLRPRPFSGAPQVFSGSSAKRVNHTYAKRKGSSAEEMIQQKNAQNKVMIYSKTYCPYCTRAKTLFQQLKVDAKVAELDNLEDGADIQSALKVLTGSGTVPQIFVNGEYIGGCTDVYGLHDSGKLVPKLDAAGVKHA